jgi:hypothetical protein
LRLAIPAEDGVSESASGCERKLSPPNIRSSFRLQRLQDLKCPLEASLHIFFKPFNHFYGVLAAHPLHHAFMTCSGGFSLQIQVFNGQNVKMKIRADFVP